MTEQSRQLIRLLRLLEKRLGSIQDELQRGKKQKEAEAAQQEAESKKGKPLAIRTEVVDLPVEEIKQLAANSDNKKWQRNQNYLSVATVAILAATLIGVFFQWRSMDSTLGEMQKQTNTLTDSVKAAQEQVAETRTARTSAETANQATLEQAKKALDATIDMAHTDQRAWLGFNSVSPPSYTVGGKRIYVQSGSRLVFAASFQNSGKTVARNVRYRFGSLVLPKASEFEPVYHLPLRHGSTAQPGAGFSFPATRLETHEGEPYPPLSDLTIAAISRETVVLYFYGEIFYEDIFQVEHRTTFCMYLQEDLTAFSSCEAYNDAT